ncbi:MAG: Fe-S cluster assembly protein SufD [Solirubrobacteraceae bacterium]|nr:Fe-S cluster assembly protein SufD [Solirubrobacteraceae bacterium]
MTDIATDFVTARRAAALEALETLEMPTFRGVPGWEFTPIDTLDLEAYPAAPGEAGALPSPPDGVVVLPLAEAAARHPELVEPHLGSLVAPSSPFSARNDAHWTDGTFVHVPRGVRVDGRIDLRTVHAQAGTALHWRTLVVLEEGAEATIVEQLTSAAADADGLANGVVELVVGQNAHLTYVGIQDLSEQTWVFGNERATVARDGRLEWVTLGFGGRDGKVFLETTLTEPGAQARVTGGYATRGRQHLDFDTRQEHAAPDTISDLAFRGILADRSSAVWRGMIKVDPGAQRIDAFQESRNLLISKKAHADAIPGLEILANDVRCTHAAAIAQIDPDQMHYLRSHGLPEPVAKRLVIEGFLGALLERFEEGELRDALAEALDRRLEAVLGV